jgi:hypothetical protein
MPPTALLEEAQKSNQKFYAQCIKCSNLQGMAVRKNRPLVGSWAPIKYLYFQVLPGFFLQFVGNQNLFSSLLHFMSVTYSCCSLFLFTPTLHERKIPTTTPFPPIAIYCMVMSVEKQQNER